MLKSIFIINLLLCCTLLYAQEKDTTFTLCENGGVWPYYHRELKYKGSFWEIKKHYQSEYPIAKFQNLKNNSGIITIQFKVNCKGETGEFALQQYGLNYQPTTLDEKITNYFMEQTKQLKDWIPLKDQEGKTINSHKFFSFRIKAGDLIEILPK
jgi:hypothetical protein